MSRIINIGALNEKVLDAARGFGDNLVLIFKDGDYCVVSWREGFVFDLPVDSNDLVKVGAISPDEKASIDTAISKLSEDTSLALYLELKSRFGNG